MGRRFSNAPKRYGISLQCAGSDDVQQKSEADSNQSQFMRGRVLRIQCLRRRTSGTRRSLQGTAPQPSSSSRDGFRSRTTHSTAQRTRRTQAYRKTMLGCTTVDMKKKRLSVGRVDTTNNTAGLFTKHLDGPRTQSFARKLGLRILEGTNDVWELLNSASSRAGV